MVLCSYVMGSFALRCYHLCIKIDHNRLIQPSLTAATIPINTITGDAAKKSCPISSFSVYNPSGRPVVARAKVGKGVRVGGGTGVRVGVAVGVTVGVGAGVWCGAALSAWL